MPVVFQPPGPFAPGAAIGGGAAEVIERTLPSLVQQQGIQAQLQEQYQRVSQARDAEADRMALARQQLAQQGQVTPAMQFQAQTQAGLANQHTQAQAALAAQHARLQAEVHFGALSQAEQFRLQQLQQGINTVDQEVSKGVLSEEEGEQYKIMLRTKIDPLQQRFLKNRLQQQELATQQALQQAQMWKVQQGALGSGIAATPLMGPNGEPVGYLYGAPDGKGGLHWGHVPMRAGGTPSERTDKPIDHAAELKHVEDEMRHLFPGGVSETGKEGTITADNYRRVKQERFEERLQAIQEARRQEHRGKLPGDDSTDAGRIIRNAAEQANDPRVIRALDEMWKIRQKPAWAITPEEAARYRQLRQQFAPLFTQPAQESATSEAPGAPRPAPAAAAAAAAPGAPTLSDRVRQSEIPVMPWGG